jgi:hypothetical protein
MPEAVENNDFIAGFHAQNRFQIPDIIRTKQAG